MEKQDGKQGQKWFIQHSQIQFQILSIGQQ